MSDYSDLNRRVTDEFRSTGQVAGFGELVTLLHTTGARSGEERVTPVGGVREPDGSWLLAATFAGRDENPAWYYNLVAHPDAMLETADVHDGVGIAVRAEVLGEPERTEAYARLEGLAEGYRTYPSMTERVIPVVRLTPVDPA